VPVRVTVEDTGPDLRISLHGELDLLTTQSLALPPPDRPTRLSRLVVDLSMLAFCDTAGLRALDKLLGDYSGAGHEVLVHGASATLRRIAAITGLTAPYLS